MMFISILDSNGPYSTPHFQKDHSNVITLTFDDVTKDGESSPTVASGTKAFTDQHATKLYKFIKNNKDAQHCVVHCAAGISRSGAIGEVINDMYGDSYVMFKKRNPQTIPNIFITSKLRNLIRNDSDND